MSGFNYDRKNRGGYSPIRPKGHDPPLVLMYMNQYVLLKRACMNERCDPTVMSTL